MIGLFAFSEEMESQPAQNNAPPPPPQEDPNTLRARYNGEDNTVRLTGVGFSKLRFLPQESPDIATGDFMKADGMFTGYDVVSDKFILISDNEISIQLNFGRYFGAQQVIDGATLFSQETYLNINGLGRFKVN